MGGIMAYPSIVRCIRVSDFLPNAYAGEAIKIQGSSFTPPNVIINGDFTDVIVNGDFTDVIVNNEGF